MPWGADLSAKEGFRKLGEHLGVSYWVKPDRRFLLDGIEVDNVVYGAHQGRFFAVYITVAGIDTFGRLRRHLQQKYGNPRITMEADPQQTVYTWKSERVKIKMKHREAEGRMKLAFYYRPLSETANLAQQEAFEEPPRRLFPLTEQKRQKAVEHFNLLNF